MTIHFFEAHLQLQENSGFSAGTLDPYVVVFLVRDREGSKQKTSVARKTLDPVWNQSLVFHGLDYSEEIRVEIKANRQFQVNDFLCGFDFKVQDVMGQSGDDYQSSYGLRGEKVFGTLLAAFDFDPPVPLDAAEGGVDREVHVAAEAKVEDPAFLNVERNFACLLLDSDLAAAASGGGGGGGGGS